MSRAAIRYAKAVLSLAQDKKTTEDVQKDMQSIITTVSDSAELKMVLNSPLIKSEIKLASLKEIFKSTGELTQNLFDVLIENKRVDLLGDVAKQYIVLLDKSNNTQVATVTTAIPLDKGLSAKVQAKVKELTGNEATIENVIDESIIGGFILRVGDLQYNASIANKLTNLKRELSN
ncbi:ATP synthase F1 subunit delta [Aquimarina sp. AD10]|uniref:ATP synthase subunit delta n=1 Tax=Aquimarina aggregata TaxID=1642818 RepID=A0A163BHV3_9FLAO|nr:MULTISPECIES: ATP synthase F1 subunit delta [Aquimarina]AXT61797.1 ATP synthase F1 subunit delta [Aquimarina sp. AD10]KZS41412.1 ATP synthase subunit delta [Aquimarina aggregata]RKN02595.1 ATP synthase F1 subunit delta [Aquimarina sp. AD10]